VADTSDVMVIGAGVLGIFLAYHARRRGLSVLLLERDDQPRQASARNFGMIIPSGMPPGDWQRRAQEGAALYRQLAERLPLPLSRLGTQYLATTPAELQVLREFAELGPRHGYECQFLDGPASVRRNAAISAETCLGSLHFPGDLRVEPRELLRQLLHHLVNDLGVTYRPRTVCVQAQVRQQACRVTASDGVDFEAGHVFVTCGADLRTLFAERFARSGLHYCKLQMLRLAAPGVALPTALASGLSLRRYHSFRLCPSWPRLNAEVLDPELMRHGVHVLLVQDGDGSVVVGDSHAYTPDAPDDTLEEAIDALILREARRLVRLPVWGVTQRWQGVYALHAEQELFAETIDERIHILTGIGGKGMTTGPVLAREWVERVAE
jgi:FAD dependent oxidoreductase TIGR03364